MDKSNKDITQDDLSVIKTLSGKERSNYIASMADRVAHGGGSDSNVRTELVQLAESDDLTMREAWVNYFGASKAEEFAPLLGKWLLGGDEDLSVLIVYMLGLNKSPLTNEILLHCLQTNPIKYVRRTALKILVRRASLGYKMPFDLLKIADPDDWRPITRREYDKFLEKSSIND